MFGFREKSKMIAPERALRGRQQEMPVADRHAVLGTPMRPPFPEGFEQLVVGMGCFWGAERVFWQAEGVYTTAVGYAGGYTPNPTYEEVCSGSTGHAEVVLVVFDPAKTTYEQMLALFWENHNPTQGMRQGNDRGTQYRSAIYWDTDRPSRASHASRDAYNELLQAQGYPRSPPRSPRPARSTTPRTTTSSICRRTRGATAGSAAPASAARSASPPPPRSRSSPRRLDRPTPSWNSRQAGDLPGRLAGPNRHVAHG